MRGRTSPVKGAEPRLSSRISTDEWVQKTELRPKSTLRDVMAAWGARPHTFEPREPVTSEGGGGVSSIMHEYDRLGESTQRAQGEDWPEGDLMAAARIN
jgi:hypothetical protein